jgi:hypothetical protein
MSQIIHHLKKWRTVKMTRREYYRQIIQEVIKQFKPQGIKILRKELRKAFPCPPCKYWPYKLWRDEIRVQLGLKKSKFKVDTQTKSLFGYENEDKNAPSNPGH